MRTIRVIWRYLAPRYPHPQIVAGHLFGMVIWGGLVKTLTKYILSR